MLKADVLTIVNFVKLVLKVASMLALPDGIALATK
jgi:hypothetical protein